jgi:hypothetical protein
MKNLLLISLIFGVLVLGCKENQSNGGSPSSGSTQTAATPAPKDVISNITWQDYDNIYSIRSNSTDMQKESAWSRFDGKRVQWTGTVVDITKGTFGGITLNVKMNKETLVYDASISLKESETPKASQITKGKTVTFVATLKNYGGAILPCVLSDGELK